MAITKDQVLQMDYSAIKEAIKNPATSQEMQNLLRDRQVVSYVSELMLAANNEIVAREAAVTAGEATIPPTTEELARQAADMADTAPVAASSAPITEPAAPAAPVVSQHEAELAEAGIALVKDPSGKILRYIQDYQVADDNNQPIGRPTHLESPTLSGLIIKQRDAHKFATQAFHRLKKQKLTFKNEEPKMLLTPAQIQEAASKALEAKDAKSAEEIVRSILKTDFAQQELDIQQRKEYAEGQVITAKFLRRHVRDYNPCQANYEALVEYLTTNQMDFTLDNLEAAFTDLLEQGDKLAPFEGTTASVPAAAAPITPAAAPAPAASAAVLPPAVEVVLEPATPAQSAAISQPAAVATAPTPVPAANPQGTRRPGVNGAIAPGTLSAQRPGTPDPALDRKAFLKTVKAMTPEVMKAKLKNDPQFVKQLVAYGIKVQ